jgi:hypothetical protein
MTESNQTSAEWGGIEDAAGLLAVRVGVWNHFGYAAPEDGQAAIPPLGERNADAIRAGHSAVELIDEIIRDLYRLREQLVAELHTDAEAHGRRADQMIAEARARREDGAR